jgi:hypothetical protein
MLIYWIPGSASVWWCEIWYSHRWLMYGRLGTPNFFFRTNGCRVSRGISIFCSHFRATLNVPGSNPCVWFHAKHISVTQPARGLLYDTNLVCWRYTLLLRGGGFLLRSKARGTSLADFAACIYRERGTGRESSKIGWPQKEGHRSWMHAGIDMINTHCEQD